MDKNELGASTYSHVRGHVTCGNPRRRPSIIIRLVHAFMLERLIKLAMHAWNCGISARDWKKSWKVQSWRSNGGGEAYG
jgi:hypothetical protein